MLFCRCFKKLLFEMHKWVNNRSIWDVMKDIFSGSWFFVAKIFFLLGVPLFAIRYVVKGYGRRGSGEEKSSNESSSDPHLTENEDTASEDIGDTVISVKEESPREKTEDYICECDSTWDSDTEDTENSPDLLQEESTVSAQRSTQKGQSARMRFKQVSGRTQSFKFQRFQTAARDLQNYRHDYPIKPLRRGNFQDHDDEHPNLDFYLGKRPSSPDNVYINDFHTLWRGKYEDLEDVHSYIQWLFPLQEPGVNREAPTLTKVEIEEFRRNDMAKKHLLESYKLMLDFYGIELCDETTGAVKRSCNWLDRFTNLNRNTHNNLRITRILKCLGTLGFAHYQAPLVHFFLEETLVNGELPRVKDSVLNYFLFTVLDKKQRRNLLKFAYLNFDKRDEFVWCPMKIQMKWAK
ncbi:hypothetical protein WMY93_016059 [Mugilogobius chulae]|uniref:Opioid growth factor receptor (OGFr) conserved domain-containing protein n=1 Tax=Mugilogobius chulae TaxID=88201 RepID=A0AAW0NUE3_9GOBI